VLACTSSALDSCRVALFIFSAFFISPPMMDTEVPVATMKLPVLHESELYCLQRPEVCLMLHLTLSAESSLRRR
jgi:hypothetical protein